MSDEIKEYLDTLKEIVGEGKSKGTYGISYWHWKEILDYITNLQQEKEDYKSRVEKAIEELFELKDMIYKPETREENFPIQRKISKIIINLGGKDE